MVLTVPFSTCFHTSEHLFDTNSRDVNEREQNEAVSVVSSLEAQEFVRRKIEIRMTTEEKRAEKLETQFARVEVILDRAVLTVHYSPD